MAFSTYTARLRKNRIALFLFALAFFALGIQGQSRTPFVDLLPSLAFAGPYRDAILGFPAHIPASAQVDVRERPYLSFIYASPFQQNIDLWVGNSSDQALAEFGPTTNVIRLTLPRTSGFPRLWTVALTNLLIAGRADYHVAKISFSNANPMPHRLELQALGFSADAPPQTPHISITATNTTNQLFFYNGYIRYAPDLQSDWITIPGARNNFITNGVSAGFFTIAPFDLSIPDVNLQTNLPSGSAGGYMSVRINTGFQIIANQLVSTNSVGACLNPQLVQGTLQNGSAIIKIDEPYSLAPPGSEDVLNAFLETFGPIDRSRVCINLYENGVWTDPSQSLAPREGAIFFNPGNEFTVFFPGTHLTGILMNQVPAGISIRASLIPDNGGISTRHGFQPTVGDTVTRFLSGNVVTYVYGEGGVWDPAEPTIASGEGVLINAQNPFVWTRYFSTGR